MGRYKTLGLRTAASVLGDGDRYHITAIITEEIAKKLADRVKRDHVSSASIIRAALAEYLSEK